MGFFDDLEETVGSGFTGADDDTGGATRFDTVLDRLRDGWVFTDTVTTPGPEKEQFIDEEIRLSYEAGRYRYASRLAKRRGRLSEPEAEHTRSLDRDDLIELLQNQPAVGLKAIAAVERSG